MTHGWLEEQKSAYFKPNGIDTKSKGISILETLFSGGKCIYTDD